MKKKLKKALIIFMCLATTIPISIFAANEGGTGSSGGNSGGAGGFDTDCTPGTYWQIGYDDGSGGGAGTTAAFRYDLVYKEQNGGREILKTVIVQVPSRAYNKMEDGQNYIISSVKDYNDAVNATGTAKYGSKYITSGPLADLSNRLLNGETIDSIFCSGLDADTDCYGLDADTEQNKKLIESYLTSSEGFDVEKKDLQRPQDDNPGTYNSYGYRIMIQKIQIFQNGCGGPSCWKAMTRKDAASGNAIKQHLFGNAETWISPVHVIAGEDLFTTRDDMGVSNARDEMEFFKNATSGADVRVLTKNFADYNDGTGYNILWFPTDPFINYDYSIDSACVNCLATGLENKAYVIQDTTNWEAILASPNSSIENAKNYYNKGNGVFCREEYTVNFPTVSNHITVNTGRYFTVNATNEELATLTSSVPNFKPITVTRTRQCRSTTNNIDSLNNFERNSRNTFKDNAGTVTLKYTENKENSEYSKKSIVLEPDEYASNTYSSSINDNMLTMTQTVSYTLEDDVYRYVRLQDGLSIFDPNGIDSNDLKTKYKDIGIANLPISFENETSGNGKIADVQLSYELPNDPNSKIKAAYKMNNDYFEDSSNHSVENIYSKAIKAGAVSDNSIVKGSLTDEEYNEIIQSACAKLYKNDSGYSSGLYNCVYNRTKNKIGNNNDCILHNNLDNSDSGYICPISRNPNEGICRIENGKYYLGDGKEVTKEEYEKVCPNPGNGDTCRIENGKYYDFDGNEITKEEYERICPNSGNGDTCRIENGKYYDFDGNEITKEEYERICPATPTCPEDECPYGCCPSGECAPMPDGTCPGIGGKDVIYRTIDLEDPFPGQDAEQRNTGANWCSYDPKTQKIDCSYDNQTVKNYITRQRGSGDTTTKNGDKVYKDDHILYEVTLDSKTIRNIREYNDDHKYDDWTLVCKDNGRVCISQFLNDEVETSGECAGAESVSSFKSCDKDV